MEDFNLVKKVYFLGIGGIGVSALARMFIHDNKAVFGSDTSPSEIIDELVKVGANVFIGQDLEHIPLDTDLVIYSIALDIFVPEFMKKVRERVKKVISYPEALSVISKNKFTIAISGTHGKTTTTAMVAKILIDANLDPTVIVGSILKDVKSNFIAGKSKPARMPNGEAGGYLVVEACEYCRSFLKINPTVVGITTIDDDHLDYYKDSSDIENAFKEFVTKVPEDGAVVGNLNDEKIKEAASVSESKIINSEDFYDESLLLKIPGVHNRKDASVALAIADFIGIPKEVAIKSIKEFSGTWRRFEYKGETSNGAKIYDDYGHHPAEIKATIAGTREAYPSSKIIVVFQPHLFSRTKLLLSDFKKAFVDADKVILLPIYPAREEFDSTIKTDDIITENSKNIEMAKDFSDASKKAFEYGNKGDVVLVMGAGDVYEVTNLLLGI